MGIPVTTCEIQIATKWIELAWDRWPPANHPDREVILAGAFVAFQGGPRIAPRDIDRRAVMLWRRGHDVGVMLLQSMQCYFCGAPYSAHDWRPAVNMASGIEAPVHDQCCSTASQSVDLPLKQYEAGLISYDQLIALTEAPLEALESSGTPERQPNPFHEAFMRASQDANISVLFPQVYTRK